MLVEEEDLVQLISLIDGGSGSFLEFRDETVLIGTTELLHTSFHLRGVGIHRGAPSACMARPSGVNARDCWDRDRQSCNHCEPQLGCRSVEYGHAKTREHSRCKEIPLGITERTEAWNSSNES